jgi:hypothetical protein
MDDEDNISSTDSNWKYSSDIEDTTIPQNSASTSNAAIEKYNWTSEDVFSINKTASWYIILAVVTIVFSGLVYLFTKDAMTAGVIFGCGILVAIYGAKKPKAIDYEIDSHGFKIGQRVYTFVNYRSFTIINEGSKFSVVLVPLRRFMPYTYLNFNADIQDKVLAPLRNNLPYESKRQDYLDKVFRRIGF